MFLQLTRNPSIRKGGNMKKRNNVSGDYWFNFAKNILTLRRDAPNVEDVWWFPLSKKG